MPLPTSPNKVIPTALRQDDSGWPVFALQRGLDNLGYHCEADGDFGPLTRRAVQLFQVKENLALDGVAGPATQDRISRRTDWSVHIKHADLPEGLLRGFAMTESGNNLGATNWSIPGGVDCGIVQIRCLEPFSESNLKAAYDPLIAMERVAVTFSGRVAAFLQFDYASKVHREWAMRCAALAWNWPWAAEQFAAQGRLPNPFKPASWAVVGGQRIKFPDGTPVMTYDDWARFYALGSKHGEGRVTRFVTNW